MLGLLMRFAHDDFVPEREFKSRRVAWAVVCVSFFFQAEDGIRDLVRSRGLGDVYKRQVVRSSATLMP